MKKRQRGEKFAVFHEVIKNLLGSKHFRIEQSAIRILHERTKEGIYSRTNELAAFDLLVGVFIQDAEESIQAVRQRDHRDVSAYIEDLEKSVKVTQAKLRDAERLAIIGQTAGMVGHDIRNPLQAITSDLFLLREDVKLIAESETRRSMLESINSIDENVVYINKIITDLQDFARRLTPTIEETSMEDLFKTALSSIDVPEGIEILNQIEPRMSEIKTDKSFIVRILTNLVNNAVQAMPNGGRIVLNATSRKSTLTITVQDNGQGIPENVKSKLFTPLFTTKAKGQGFGLPVVKRLSEALGGTVTFESEAGNGTKFK